MTDDVLMPSDELIERALGRRAPRGPDADLLRLITATAERTPQRRAWWPVGLPRMGEPARRVIWIAVLLVLALAFALGAIVAGGLPPSPAVVVEPLPSGSAPPPSSVPTTALNAPVAIEDVTNSAFGADQTYTSRRFEPWVTFRLADGLGGTYFRPSPDTSARSLVFPYRSGTGELRLMRPYAVDCGTPDAHPDAATLAAAILARPGMSHVRDLGLDPYTNADALSTNLISGTYPKRVLLIDASSRPFESGISDPDRCRLLMEPGGEDPTIEIRGDMTALLILTDVGGELVVVRVSEQGYDATSGAIALRDRDGYQSSPDLLAGRTPIYLGDILDLETVYDLHRAEPAADPLGSAAPEASPTGSPDARTSGEPPPSALAALAIEEAGDLSSPGRTYTSDQFLPQITFEVGHTNGRAEVCLSPQTSARSIVLRHIRGCVQDVRIIRPFGVDCGLADSHPGADALAEAILHRLGPAAGEESTPAAEAKPAPVDTLVPWGLLPGPEHRRVIDIPGSRQFDATGTDPDGCRLLPEPGSSDPAIEIRGDIPATFVLLDVGDALVVVRASVGGYDAVSGAEAVERGYAATDTEGMRHLLQIVRNIRFD